MDNNHQLTTPAIDLLAPSSRFALSSRLYGRLHRWRLLLRRFWWVIGLILILVLVPAYFYSAELPAAYQSKARMWLCGRLNLSEGRLYTEELMDYLATQSELLRSPAIQQPALARLLIFNRETSVSCTAAVAVVTEIIRKFWRLLVVEWGRMTILYSDFGRRRKSIHLAMYISATTRIL